MTDRIVVKEEELEQMIAILQRSAEELGVVERRMQAIAKKMESGAFLGDGGEAFAAGLSNNMSRSLQALMDKLMERSQYVQRELDQNRSARRGAQGRF